jgi:hypothetical protein
MCKRIGTILIVVTILIPLLVTDSAWAGSKQRHRWEGIAIGLGAVLVGNALAQACGGYDQPAYAGCCRPTYSHVPPPVTVYPQTRVIYYHRETVREIREVRPHGHRAKPWRWDKHGRWHRRHWR